MFKLIRKCGSATWRRLISEDPTVKGNSAGQRGRGGQQAPEGQKERSQGPQAQTPHGHQVWLWRLLPASEPSQHQVLIPKTASTAEMRQEPEEQPRKKPHLCSCSFIPFEVSSFQVYRSHSSPPPPDCKLQEDRNPPCLTPPDLHSVCKLGAQEMAFSGRMNQ